MTNVAWASLVGLVLALFVLAPAAALAQDGNENDGQRAELYGSWDDTIWHIIPLYGDRAACVQGLGFFVRAEFWSMFDEPVVLSGASYNWSQQDLQVAIFRDVGPIEDFDCGDGEQIATVEVAPSWDIRTDGPDFVSVGAPFEAMTEAISVYGFEFSMNVTPNRRPALPKVWYNEDFSGVFTNGGGSSFNVAGSPSWGELFHRYGEIYIAEFRQAQALPANEARSRLAALLQECPENDACSTRVMVKSVIKGNVYGLVHELTRRSDTFRDLYYDSPKEALVEELMAGLARERSGSSRHARRTQLVEKALAGFEGDIDPDLADMWDEVQEHETRRHDARELDRLDERLTDAIADEGEADDDLRAEVRRAAENVQGDWGEDRVQLLREWAAYEIPEEESEQVAEGEENPREFAIAAVAQKELDCGNNRTATHDLGYVVRVNESGLTWNRVRREAMSEFDLDEPSEIELHDNHDHTSEGDFFRYVVIIEDRGTSSCGGREQTISRLGVGFGYTKADARKAAYEHIESIYNDVNVPLRKRMSDFPVRHEEKLW